jgi:hypothetical protein
MRLKSGILIAGLVTVVPLSGLSGWTLSQSSPDQANQTIVNARGEIRAAFNDPIARLQQAIDDGLESLEFDDAHGYLPALLDRLEIPVSSQVLPFARSSFQIFQISPEAPRALYFNDDVYIGRVLGIPTLEFAAIDPEVGVVFYTLEEDEEQSPQFVLQDRDCIICHDSSRTPGIQIPRLLVLSVLPNADGSAIGRAALNTTDQSPFDERWGGWYVTGTHGDRFHLGNLTVNEDSVDKDLQTNAIDIRREIDRIGPSERANLLDLSDRFDTSRYLTPDSDIVALMVLGHQTHVLNLIMRANYEAGAAIREDEAAGRPISETTMTLVDDAAEGLVRSMLFVDAAPLTGPVVGTSSFASQFADPGPFDSRGRSLRELDLERRLFQYPLSFVIYSESFDALPDLVKDRVVERLSEVLEGQDSSEEFAHLEALDRRAILEILRDTKPEFDR